MKIFGGVPNNGDCQFFESDVSRELELAVL
jgi:hypothetical protein